MASDYQTQIANTADQRTLGYFPLSIATSLAIESAVNIHPDIPPARVMPIKQYGALWVNMRTLYRNIMNAMAPNIALGIHPLDVAQILVEEMAVIPDMLQEYAGYPVPVKYYLNGLQQLAKKCPEAELRTDNSPKQLALAATAKDAFTIVLRDRPGLVITTPDQLPGESAKTLIITHMAYDLLSARHFESLTLLESHTGAMKNRPLWHTKFYQGKTLSQIPFTLEMLEVFGDNETFHPLDKKLREALLAVAAKRQWNYTTTRDRIVTGIDDLPNPAHQLKMKKIYGLLF